VTDDLKALLARFDAFYARALRRLIAGAERYGSAWRERDNQAELLDELADALNYCFFLAMQAQVGRRRRRKRRKPQNEHRPQPGAEGDVNEPQ
jgi:NTP pyrophosphatase (non-canonical NTP hydrolase)